MAFRFWRRFKLAPGITLNLSKSGGSLSFGPRGAHLTIGPRGNRVTGGVPGTGLFYTQRIDGPKGKRGRSAGRPARPGAPDRQAGAAPTIPAADRLTMGFFKRLFTPADEENLVDGMREYVLGNTDRARDHLRRAAHLADAAFLVGVIALGRDDFAEAARHFETADRRRKTLGRHFERYGISATASIDITPELTAHVRPTPRGVLLALTELYQRKGDADRALACLDRLWRVQPDDPVVCLSLVELLFDAAGGKRDRLQRIVRLTADVRNETAVHAALLFYKGRALAALGLHRAARDTFTGALRRRKDRPADLLQHIRYERALVYEAMGKSSRYREELERLYSEAPDFEGLSERLGIDT